MLAVQLGMARDTRVFMVDPMIKSRKQQDIGNLLDLTAPAPGVEPPRAPVEPRRPPHEAGCWCQICWSCGLEYGLYLQAKRLRDANGF